MPACTLIMEITTPDGNNTVPILSGWALRTWPVARLGDVTLEAQARFPHLGGEDLREALDAQGYRILGPVHARQISAAEK